MTLKSGYLYIYIFFIGQLSDVHDETTIYVSSEFYTCSMTGLGYHPGDPCVSVQVKPVSSCSYPLVI